MSPFDLDEALPPESGDVIRAPVVAGKSGLEGVRVDGGVPEIALAGVMSC